MVDSLDALFQSENVRREMARPSKSHARATIAVSLLLLYIVIVLMATMSPTPLDQGYEASIDRLLGVLHRNGVPQWFGYSKLEFLANILMFVPLGVLVGLALPQRAAWSGVILLPLFSVGIVPVEAQGAGTPVVTGPVGGQVETYVDGESGVTADSTDAVDLARAIERAIGLTRFDGATVAARFSEAVFQKRVREFVEF